MSDEIKCRVCGKSYDSPSKQLLNYGVCQTCGDPDDAPAHKPAAIRPKENEKDAKF